MHGFVPSWAFEDDDEDEDEDEHEKPAYGGF
jgi:hypothetical protein